MIEGNNYRKIPMRYFIFIILLATLSCSQQSPESNRIEKTIGKRLHLEMFQTIFFKGDTISYEKLQEEYKYKYIVYLLNECSPCYDKYIRWHKEMEQIKTPDNFTVLFIIKGKYIYDFLSNVNSIEYVEDKYYIAMDPNYIYPDGNKDIPEWLIEYPILIDNDNKIRMIGLPFSNTKSIKEFKKIIQN